VNIYILIVWFIECYVITLHMQHKIMFIIVCIYVLMCIFDKTIKQWKQLRTLSI